MQICNTINAVNRLHFNGIKPRYNNEQNYNIIPISKDPTQDEIDEAIKATKNAPFAAGYNGRAYFLGEDLVVKKYKAPEEVASYNPEREIRALDVMYNMDIQGDGFQEGKYAFKSPDGQTYLISNKLKGSRINSKTNPFNGKNLSSLMQIIEKLDTPFVHYSTKDNDYCFEIPMHYDVSEVNVIISPETASVLDFEYMRFEDLTQGFKRFKERGNCGLNTNISDIPGIISNLRNFEFSALIDYLMELPEDEARSLFLKYIDLKSEYNTNLSNKYRKYRDIETCDTIFKSYKNNAAVLKRAALQPENNQDIISAEARKIQMVSYIYNQSPAEGTKTINPRQIENYTYETKDFFEKQYHKAIEDGDLEKENYYHNCIELMKGWIEVISWLHYQEQEPIRENFKDEESYNSAKSQHEFFIKKITPHPRKPLDRVVSKVAGSNYLHNICC